MEYHLLVGEGITRKITLKVTIIETLVQQREVKIIISKVINFHLHRLIMVITDITIVIVDKLCERVE